MSKRRRTKDKASDAVETPSRGEETPAVADEPAVVADEPTAVVETPEPAADEPIATDEHGRVVAPTEETPVEPPEEAVTVAMEPTVEPVEPVEAVEAAADPAAPVEVPVAPEPTPEPVPAVAPFKQVGVYDGRMTRIDGDGREWNLGPWIVVEGDACVARREWLASGKRGRELALAVYTHGGKWGLQVVRPKGSPSPKVEWKDYPGDLAEVCLRADLLFAQEAVGRDVFLLQSPEGMGIGTLTPHPLGFMCATRVWQWLTGSAEGV